MKFEMLNSCQSLSIHLAIYLLGLILRWWLNMGCGNAAFFSLHFRSSHVCQSIPRDNDHTNHSSQNAESQRGNSTWSESDIVSLEQTRKIIIGNLPSRKRRRWCILFGQVKEVLCITSGITCHWCTCSFASSDMVVRDRQGLLQIERGFHHRCHET